MTEVKTQMSDDLAGILAAKSFDRNGKRIIPFFACREAARKCGATPRRAEITALRNGICPSRYERSVGTFGLEGQARLLESRAAVVGCGGLGGWIIEILARAGVGEIVMADGDVFDDNNLNRQLYAHEENIGMSKAEAAAERVRLVNGAVSAIPKTLFVNEENGAEVLNGCSVVIDALDGNSARSAVLNICSGLGIPFVHGAIGGCFAQCAVYRPGDRPLWERAGTPDKGGEVTSGNPPFTPPFAASIEAAEALKILAGLDGALNGELLWFDLRNNEMRKLRIH